MNKILSATAATLIAAASIAASAAPASAGGGITFGFGGGYGGPVYGGPLYGGPYGGGVYVDVGPGYGPGPGYNNTWKKHVKWCLSHYKSYNPNTNLFKTKWGPQECESPFYY